MKKLALVVLALVVAGSLALALVVRRVLTGENIRAAVAAQVSAAIGQPVTIGAIGASIYPRVTMDLTDVRIGPEAGVQLQSVHIGVALRALLSRRIENAAVRVDGARVALPLPAFTIGGGEDARDAPGASALPVQIVSIDEIVLRDVDVLRGDRRLHGDVELVPRDGGIDLRRVALAVEDTAVEMTGRLTSLAPLAGRLDVTANTVDFDRLLAFLGDFAGVRPGTASATAGAPGTVSAGALTIALTLGRATSGALELSDLRTTALVTSEAVTLDPIAVGVFGGRYEGAMRVTLGDPPRTEWRGAVAGVDTAALMAFAGSPDSISGRLSGRVSLEGARLEVERALRTARGTARIDVADGAIEGLALVRTIVLATSGRGGYIPSAGAAIESHGQAGEAERFSRLGATLAFAGGQVTTRDFAMTSTDVDLTGVATIRLETMTTRLDGEARLSEALSKQGGTDLYRYAQEGGRVTVPAIVSGSIDDLSVRIDLGDAARRAIRNRAAEEAQKAIERNLPRRLKDLLPKRPPPLG